jgi:methionine-rich copper-binding protein CopC/putative copper export protein
VAIASLLVAAVAVLVPGGIARAHAIVDDVSPADGSALVDAPDQVVFTFTEPILADGIGVEVTTSSEASVPTAAATLDPADPTRVLIDLGPMINGTYQVRLSVRDLEDLHEVIARTSFAIGETAPAPSPPIVDTAEPMETGARWMFATGLALIFGVIAVRTKRSDVPITREGRLRSLALAGGVLVLVGRIGTLAARMFDLGGDPLDNLVTVLRTSDTQRLLLVAVALGCVAVSELPHRAVGLDVPVRPGHDLTCRQALGWVGAVNLAVLAAWGGHSALSGSIAPGTVLAKTGHLVGLGLWVGVLAVVVAVNAGSTNLRPALSAMSRVAVIGAFVTVVSGLVLTSRLIVSLTAWASTPYGILLAVKIVLIAVGVALGLVMRRARRPGWSFSELSVLGVVVLLGAAMATATPALDPGFTDRSQVTSALQPAVQADDLLLQARAIPARPGINAIEIRIGETRRPSPGAVTSVDVAVGNEQFVATPNGDGVAYLEGVTLSGGDTTLQAVVHRAGWSGAAASLIVTAQPPAYVHPAFITSARISGAVLALAVVISLFGLFIVARKARQRAGSRRQFSGPVRDR